MMLRVKEFYQRDMSWINGYWLVAIGCVLLTFTTGDSSLYQRYLYDQKIRALEKEIRFYRNETEQNVKKLHRLKTDKEGLERFAREEYFMKKEHEEVFIINSR